MSELIFASTPVARKRYDCDASIWLDNCGCLDELGLSYAELRSVVRARRNGWQIVPGQRYIREVQKDGGVLFVWRAIPEIDEICRKHEIYDY